MTTSNDQKAHLKAMVNHMIEKDDAAAATEFHAYLANKMQSALEKINTISDTQDGE